LTFIQKEDELKTRRLTENGSEPEEEDEEEDL